MNTTKTQALMYIILKLLQNKEISKEDILNVISASDLKFRRYMQEVRAFFYNFNIPVALKYSRSQNKYYLVEEKPI